MLSYVWQSLTLTPEYDSFEAPGRQGTEYAAQRNACKINAVAEFAREAFEQFGIDERQVYVRRIAE